MQMRKLWLVNVIGLLTTIGDVIHSSKDDVYSKRVTIEIEDRVRSRVSATLWGRYCDQIEKFMNKHKEGAVIIALQYCNIKVFNGQRSLSNSMHATRILINEKLEEFMVFHDQVTGSNLRSPLIGSSSSSIKSVSCYADSFNSVSISCISELFLSADDSVHCIIGSVLKVNTDKAWFYNACTKCKMKVEEDGERFYCNYCATPMSTAIPRFRLELVVIDDTAPANFTLFDRDAANFLGVSTEFMKNRAEKVDDDSMQSLAEFDKFLGIRFVFKVSANDENGDTNIGSSFSQDVIAVDIFGENLTPIQEADKFALNKVLANRNNAMEGRSLSFSEEVTSQDRYTTSSNMGNSSEESNTKRRVHDFNEVINNVSQEVLKKVKLE
ncbi:replication protein A 70 kDa DNA-binding subunit B-like [Senna tora]|uniref:Replication protein A 70 kDa DNA-binding subunit B-like n=1 Tax=Senna tora TaxID=362788 RepID=A0A834WT70_9FABA|nr:replication protein A 70 kDa DNA-binding subunit B-like [Senna tora]